MPFIYNYLMLAGLIFGLPVIIPLMLLSRKRRKNILQRLGLVLPDLPEKFRTACRLWIHALSVGEVVSSVPLVRELAKRFGRENIVFSASTLTGFSTARSQVADQVSGLFFFPLDLIFSVCRVIRRVAPDGIIIVETDIWPNFMAQTARQNLPVFLVNARLSDRSLSGYKKTGFLTRPVFGKFSRICTQSRSDAERFRQIGVLPERISVTGNIKFDQPVAPFSAAEATELRARLGIPDRQKIIVAGSTHEGEEEILSVAFKILHQMLPDICLIIAPRNPDRAISVCNIFREAGFSAMTMAQAEKNSSGNRLDVLVVDRIGVLKQFYELGDAAFIGGSLIAFGGHNPLEPAAFGKPVLFGPHMKDFREIAALLLENGGAVQVRNAETLCHEMQRLLTNPDHAESMGSRALQVFCSNAGAVARTVECIAEYFRNEKAGKTY